MVEKFETIKISEWVLEAGNLIGVQRNIYAFHLNKNPKYDRGTDQNFKGHIIGATGELIFSIYLERINKEYQRPAMLGFTKNIPWDFKVNNKTIDVKTITQDQTHFNINVDAHKKKPVDYYVLIQYAPTEAKIIYIKYQSVNNETWNVQRSFTDYYSKSINEFNTTQQHHEKK